MNKNAKALKSGVWYIISNLIVRGMTLITTPIFSRLLSQEQYGDYSNYIGWTSIMVIVLSMRTEASLISAKFDYKEELEKYNRSLIALTAVMTAVWIIIINSFPGFFTEYFGFGMTYTNLMLLYCLFSAVINIFQMNERFAYRYKTSVMIALLVAISSTIISIILVVNMSDKLTGRVLGGVLPIVVIGGVIAAYLFRKEKLIDASMWKYALKISVPYVPHLLSLQLLNSMDRIMIKRICGPADNALYTIAYTCGHMVTILMTSMNSAFAPWIGDKLNEGEIVEIRRVSKYYMVLFSGMAIFMMLLAPEILLIMGPRSYSEAKYVMTPVALGCVCQFMYTLYVNVEQYRKKTGGMAIASVLAALLNYVTNAYFIPRYGYIAAAYTTLAGYLFLFVSHVFIVHIIEDGNVFDTKFAVALILCMGIVTAGVNYLYGNPILRYIVVAITAIIALAVVYVKRDLVRKLLRLIIRKEGKKKCST